MAEVVLLVAMIAAPVLIGAVTAYVAKPWWWGAVVAVLIFLIAALAPEPEQGESRVAGGDIAFLAVAALIVAALTWIGAWAMRRFRPRSA